MALVNKRITELPERLSLQSDDYVAVDGATGGTAKFRLDKVQVGIDTTLTQQGEAADAKAVGDALEEKVDVETGKSLTTNDFTDADKTKLDGIEVQANKTIIDDTLTTAGQAADAKKVGDEITDLKDDLEAIVPGLTDEAKDALLDCFAHVAWADEHGQEYYDALYEVLYGEPVPEPDVPEGYTKYDWIHVENATTQGRDTYIKRNDQIFIPITGDKNTYKYNILATITNSNEACIMGGRDTAGSTDGTAIYMKNNGANIAIHCHGADSGYMSVSGISQTGIRNIVFNPIANPATISVDGVLNTFAWTSQSQQTDAEIALFANPVPNASYLAYNPNKNLQIGRIKVYDSSEELVCDLIPCSDQNGKYGMYDKVGETFLTSNTANTYSCGNWE